MQRLRAAQHNNQPSMTEKGMPKGNELTIIKGMNLLSHLPLTASSSFDAAASGSANTPALQAALSKTPNSAHGGISNVSWHTSVTHPAAKSNSSSMNTRDTLWAGSPLANAQAQQVLKNRPHPLIALDIMRPSQLHHFRARLLPTACKKTLHAAHQAFLAATTLRASHSGPG